MINGKQITQALIFWVVLVLLLVMIQFLLLFGASRSIAYQSAKLNYVMRHKIDPEIMVFGSSVAFVHFDDTLISQITGKETFNFGLDGNPFLQYEGLAKEYLSYTQKCKYAVFAFVFQGTSDEIGLYEPNIYYPYLYNKNIYESLSYIEPEKMFKMRYLPGYALTVFDKDFYFNVGYGYSLLFRKIKEPTRIRGYFPRMDTLFDGSALVNVKDSSLIFPVSNNTVSRIKNMLKAYEDKGITTILVVPPVKKGMLQKIKNLEECKKVFKSMQSANHYYLDYSDHTLSLEQKYFYNYTHLNKDGAAIFSQVFAEDMKQIIANRERN